MASAISQETPSSHKPLLQLECHKHLNIPKYFLKFLLLDAGVGKIAEPSCELVAIAYVAR